MKRFLKNSKGDTEMIVVIVILVGAFLLIGGQFFFQKAKTNKNTGNPGGGGENTLPAWRIEQISGKTSCDSVNQSSQMGIAFYGTAPGYYRVEIQNNDAYQPVKIGGQIYNPFTPNANNVQANDFSLKNTDGFNTKPWRIVLLEGGTLSGNDLTDATQRAEKEFDATQCP